MQTETAAYTAKRESRYQDLAILVRFQTMVGDTPYNFTYAFVTRPPASPTPGQYGLVGEVSGNTQTVDLRALTTSRGTLVIELIDRGGLITAYCGDPERALPSPLAIDEVTALTVDGSVGGYPSVPGDGVGVLSAAAFAGTLELTDGTNIERIRYAAAAGSVFSVLVRGVDGTAARAWPAGTIVHNGEQIRPGVRVVVRAGYQDTAEADMTLIGTFELLDRSLSPQRASWLLQCADLQYQADVQVFSSASPLTPVTLGPEHPALLALRIFTSTGVAGANGTYDTLAALNGAGVKAALVDTAAYVALAAATPGVSVQLDLPASASSAIAFIQSQLLAMLGATVWIDPRGLISVKRLVHTAVDADAVATLSQDNIIGIAGWSAGDQEIINVVDVGYDWKLTNLPGDGTQRSYDYQTRQVLTADKSVAKYGKKKPNATGQAFTWQGARTELGAQDYIAAFTSRIFSRFADPNPVVALQAFYGTHHLQLGDVVRLTHPHLPNTLTGLRGVTAELWQVIDTRPRWGRAAGMQLTLAALVRRREVTGDVFSRVTVTRGALAALAASENFSAAQLQQNVVLTWAAVAGADFYELREGATWDGGTVIAASLRALFYVVANVLDGSHVYRMRAFRADSIPHVPGDAHPDHPAIFGPEAIAIVSTAGNDPNRNITIDRDEVALSFPGATDGMVFVPELTPDALSSLAGLWFTDMPGRWFDELPALWFDIPPPLEGYRYTTPVTTQGKYAPTALLLTLKTRVVDTDQWFDSRPTSWFSEHAEEWFGDALSEAAVTVELRVGFAGEVGIDGAVGFWRLGEELGATKARDAGVKGNAGTYVGSPVLELAGAVNDGATAVRLDGVDDYVSLGDPANGSLDVGAGDFSIECWVRFDAALAADAYLIAKGGNGATAGYHLVYEFATSTLRVQVNDGTVSASHSTVKDLGAGWHHVVGVRDGTTLRLYLDGRERGHGTSGASVGSIDTAAALELGRLGATYMKGLLQDVALYDVALTTAQVRAHYGEAQP